MRFWLGTHLPHWLSRVDVPLFVSRTRLQHRTTLPRARGPWALDSGAFSELQRYGKWTITAAQYIAFVRRCTEEIGHLQWAAPMDWMTEEAVIRGGTVGRTRFVGTRLSLAEHQRRTVHNYLELRHLADDLPIVPVLQGQSIDDYKRIVDAYHRAGVDLHREPLVGLGSVCRRQATRQVAALVADLAATGLRLHGFGIKTAGLARHAAYLHSADSLAWSLRGRRVRPCAHGPARSEANCPQFAVAWRARVLAAAAHPQLDLLAETGVLDSWADRAEVLWSNRPLATWPGPVDAGAGT